MKLQKRIIALACCGLIAINGCVMNDSLNIGLRGHDV